MSQFGSDFERDYRQEMEIMVENGYFPSAALIDDEARPRYRWEKGRLYQDGIEIRRFQLDQTLHHFRQDRKERCFDKCLICNSQKRKMVQKDQSRLEIGDPLDGEVKGEYPCNAEGCYQTFEHLSQLMRHQEKVHNVEQDWESYEARLGTEARQAPKSDLKCLHRGRGMYGKQCDKPAGEDGPWCDDPQHKEQVLKKLKAGRISAQEAGGRQVLETLLGKNAV